MYIYTSGTTGLPKAAVIKHARYILARYLISMKWILTFYDHLCSGGLTIMIGVREDDTVYCPLPLYHRLPDVLILVSRFHPCFLQCGWYDQFEWLHGWWHHNGHQVGISAITHPLNLIIIRDKFSASNYWKDCVKYKVCRFFSNEVLIMRVSPSLKR